MTSTHSPVRRGNKPRTPAGKTAMFVEERFQIACDRLPAQPAVHDPPYQTGSPPSSARELGFAASSLLKLMQASQGLNRRQRRHIHGEKIVKDLRRHPVR